MSNEVKKYKAHICDKTYHIISDESEHHVLASVKHVDTVMRSLQEKLPEEEKHTIAVLAALQIASDKEKVELQRKEELALSSKIMDALETDSIV